jgi:ribosome-associated heat shock protein Hsp15
MGNEGRLDKWLWAVRLYKTRSLSADACRLGHVLVNGQRAKPARDVHPGEIITAKTGAIQRTVKVRGVPPSRVGAKLVPDYLEDLTPAAEYEKPREMTSAPRLRHVRARAIAGTIRKHPSPEARAAIPASPFVAK